MQANIQGYLRLLVGWVLHLPKISLTCHRIINVCIVCTSGINIRRSSQCPNDRLNFSLHIYNLRPANDSWILNTLIYITLTFLIVSHIIKLSIDCLNTVLHLVSCVMQTISIIHFILISLFVYICMNSVHLVTFIAQHSWFILKNCFTTQCFHFLIWISEAWLALSVTWFRWIFK